MRLSRAKKQLRGTDRPDRVPKPSGLDRVLTPPPPPIHISEAAAREWVALAEQLTLMGVLSTPDLRALELLCECLAQESMLRQLLTSEGMTVKAINGSSKTHPAAKLLETTRAQAVRLLEGFGLTPRSRGSVDTAPVPKRENPFLVYDKATGKKAKLPEVFEDGEEMEALLDGSWRRS